ncbi:unnamed protein product, partial [Rotaria sp. Silwood1]
IIVPYALFSTIDHDILLELLILHTGEYSFWLITLNVIVPRDDNDGVPKDEFLKTKNKIIIVNNNK